MTSRKRTGDEIRMEACVGVYLGYDGVLTFYCHWMCPLFEEGVLTTVSQYSPCRPNEVEIIGLFFYS